jgi:RsiW-degrading membrane proteinase PrsW (M82 family)
MATYLPMEADLKHPRPQPRPVTPLTHVWIVLLALVGGLLGIAGSVLSEAGSIGGFLLLPFLGAPIIEEAFKPIGVYIAMSRWPNALRNQGYVAALCALSALVFGLLESAMYVLVYAPDESATYAYFRFTVPVAMHMLASFVVGLGLTYAVVRWVSRAERLPRRSRNFYFAGVTIHAIYNTTVIALELAGVLDF